MKDDQTLSKCHRHIFLYRMLFLVRAKSTNMSFPLDQTKCKNITSFFRKKVVFNIAVHSLKILLYIKFGKANI